MKQKYIITGRNLTTQEETVLSYPKDETVAYNPIIETTHDETNPENETVVSHTQDKPPLSHPRNEMYVFIIRRLILITKKKF